jgi:hypothetical protein
LAGAPSVALPIRARRLRVVCTRMLSMSGA